MRICRVTNGFYTEINMPIFKIQKQHSQNYVKNLRGDYLNGYYTIEKLFKMLNEVIMEYIKITKKVLKIYVKKNTKKFK